MPVNEPGGLSPDRCGRFEGLRCFVTPCPGATDPGACAQLKRLDDWRKLSEAEQAGRLGPRRPTLDPALRDAVNDCPWRGPVLPLSMQDDCGCRGKELSECRAGRGSLPGRVTLGDCLDCRSA